MKHPKNLASKILEARLIKVLVIATSGLFLSAPVNSSTVRVDLRCSWTDGRTTTEFVVFDESTVFNTSIIKQESEWAAAMDSIKSSCSIDEQTIKCREDWVMLGNWGNVEVVLSRLTGALTRRGRGVTTGHTKTTPHNVYLSASCQLFEPDKSYFRFFYSHS